MKDSELFEAIFNAVPVPIFRVNEDVEILDMNQAAQKMFNTSLAQALRLKGGDVMRCINAVGTQHGCGKETPCRQCMIRNSGAQSYGTRQEIIRRHIDAAAPGDHPPACNC